MAYRLCRKDSFHKYPRLRTQLSCIERRSPTKDLCPCQAWSLHRKASKVPAIGGTVAAKSSMSSLDPAMTLKILRQRCPLLQVPCLLFDAATMLGTGINPLSESAARCSSTGCAAVGICGKSLSGIIYMPLLRNLFGNSHSPMSLNIDTFSNVTGGFSAFKAIGHPMVRGPSDGQLP